MPKVLISETEWVLPDFTLVSDDSKEEVGASLNGYVRHLIARIDHETYLRWVAVREAYKQHIDEMAALWNEAQSKVDASVGSDP